MSLDLIAALRLSFFGLGLAASLGAVETLVTASEYDDGGLLSGEFSALQWLPPRSAAVERMSRLLARPKVFLVANGVQIALALLAMVLAVRSPIPRTVLPAALLALAVARSRRTPYGGDGADQMLVILLAGLSAASLFRNDDLGQRLALWFVTAQLILSYFVAGVAKLAGKTWRDGTGIVSVLGTSAYGMPAAHKLMSSRGGRPLAFAASWLVILFEVTFPLTLILPAPWVVAYFAAGALFHLSIAIAMGLNTFLYTFLAAYPIALACLLR